MLSYDTYLIMPHILPACISEGKGLLGMHYPWTQKGNVASIPCSMFMSFTNNEACISVSHLVF